MYERSAIVLERYYNKILGFDKKVNLKNIYKDYKEIVEEIKNYQLVLQKEDEVINEFDDVANEIRKIQQEQKKIYKNIIKYEEERNKLFDSLDEDSSMIEKKLIKIEEDIDKNNKRLEELRKEFVEALVRFNEKQKERNKYSRTRREEEKNHLQIIEKSDKNLNQIDLDTIKLLKEFIKSQEEEEKEEAFELMVNNGKDEKIPFDKNVIESAVKVRDEIAKKEVECYILIYEKMRKLLSEINNDDIKLDKYNKALRDVSVKLSFLKAQKIYIVSFLDNERMTIINGIKVHKQLMLDACEKFELDMKQFSNLYELILREISGKSTKKAYKELYNKEYLKNIEEKEKNFEKEINNIKIKAGTIINSNYWRIEEIKNIYEVFQKEVSEKFEKDLSEFKLEEIEEPEEISQDLEEIEEIEEDEIFKKEISDDVNEYIDEYEEDDDYYEIDDDDEYYEDEESYDDYEDIDYNTDDKYQEDDNKNDDNYYYEDEEDDDYYEIDDGEYYEDEEENYENDNYESEDEEIIKNKKGIFNKFFKNKN